MCNWIALLRTWIFTNNGNWWYMYHIRLFVNIIFNITIIRVWNLLYNFKFDYNRYLSLYRIDSFRLSLELHAKQERACAIYNAFVVLRNQRFFFSLCSRLFNFLLSNSRTKRYISHICKLIYMKIAREREREKKKEFANSYIKTQKI